MEALSRITFIMFFLCSGLWLMGPKVAQTAFCPDHLAYAGIRHYFATSYFRLFSNPIKKARREGTTNNVKTVERANPPKITPPNPRYSSLPAPVDRTRGSMPNKLVVALMKMGRIRVRTDSMTASMPVIPS